MQRSAQKKVNWKQKQWKLREN